MSTDLAALLASDFDAGFERLVREHSQRLFALAYGLTGSREDAEEAAQDAWLRAHRALRAYDRQRVAELAPGPWLSQICANAARNLVRAKRRRPPLDAGGERQGGRERADERAFGRPEEMAMERHGVEATARALASLPEPQRAAVGLRHVAGLSYAEIAAAMSVPEGTAKSHVSRGLAALRARLAGGTLFEGIGEATA